MAFLWNWSSLFKTLTNKYPANAIDLYQSKVNYSSRTKNCGDLSNSPLLQETISDEIQIFLKLEQVDHRNNEEDRIFWAISIWKI